jgi:hypothetical protein
MRHFAIVLCLVLVGPPAAHAGWKAGSASVVITPQSSVWMAGYGARKAPSNGVTLDLHAKALVLEDDAENRSVLVTLDLCGIDRDFSSAIRDQIEMTHKVDRAHVALVCSHTHSGPVVGANLLGMYPLNDEQRRDTAEYTEVLRGKILSVVDDAFKALEPADLSLGTGVCDFAVNRRNNDQSKVPELRSKLLVRGPVDHSVPVLRVQSGDRLKAVVFGYACHCTTLSGDTFNGDYAGYAQQDLERTLPGTTALFVTGCGADQNPLPRGTIEQAQGYGVELATAVKRVLDAPMAAVEGPLRASYREIPLKFGTIPDRKVWEEEAKSKDIAYANRAKAMLATLDSGGTIPTTYPYPVQTWQFGHDLVWIFLGGEVVVDYALRIKANLDPSRTWVTAYSNDVMAYIPSLRVLKEGGYEGGGAMVYYGRPAPWSAEVEEQIFQTLAEHNKE